jgi:hypothetical protein
MVLHRPVEPAELIGRRTSTPDAANFSASDSIRIIALLDTPV